MMGKMMKEYELKLDYYGLLNLHKALLEAKFHTMPDNDEVSGSPFVADIYNQVRDLLIKSDKGSGWESWFQLSSQPDRRERAICFIRKCKRWKKASFEQKREIARNYLSPFLFSEEELSDVIAQADQFP